MKHQSPLLTALHATLKNYVNKQTYDSPHMARLFNMEPLIADSHTPVSVSFHNPTHPRLVYKLKRNNPPNLAIS